MCSVDRKMKRKSGPRWFRATILFNGCGVDPHHVDSAELQLLDRVPFAPECGIREDSDPVTPLLCSFSKFPMYLTASTVG